MDITEPDPRVVADFWAGFAAATGTAGEPAGSYAFGDSAAMADELAALVLAGTKRATAGSVRELEAEGATVAVGDLNVVHDGDGRPVCVVRTTDVRVGPLSSVDDRFAWDEGEGDRTRDWWVAAHTAYFARSFPRMGFAVEDDPQLVFERFVVVWPPEAADQRRAAPELVRAGVLDVEVERHGPDDGWPVVLLHGFPYAARSFDEVVPRLVERGAHVVVPSLRGYGGTRFVEPGTPRSGQQAALGHDLVELVEALGLVRPVVAGYDWGGRAACVASIVRPDLVGGLVSVGGYNVQDIAVAADPAPVEVERRLWYQYYLHGERGRRGLAANRRAFARRLWGEWSPTWGFTDEDFEASAAAFENPDFVDVVVHSYRHRYGLVDGDPSYEETERLLARQPLVEVPTVVLEGVHDTVTPPGDRAAHEPGFTQLVDYRQVDAGHDVPQEQPQAFADAVLLLAPR